MTPQFEFIRTELFKIKNTKDEQIVAFAVTWPLLNFTVTHMQNHRQNTGAQAYWFSLDLDNKLAMAL